VQTLEPRMMLSASLVKVINPTLEDSNPQNFAVFNGALYFTADDGVHGMELWKTDGTAGGTVPIPGVVPTGADANPYDLTNVNGTLYFFARGPSDVGVATDLWKSDGTRTGTRYVATFGSGNDLTLDNGAVYFGATDPNDFTGALWRTDGTSAGTYAVRSFGGPAPGSITNVAGMLFFGAGSALWRSDGTTAGTVELTPSAGPNVSVGGIAAASGGIYFSEGRSLWFSDGTPAGTRDVRDFPDGIVENPMILNGQVYFGATDATLGAGLWTTDGTPAGTRLIAPDATAIPGADSFPYAVLNNRLYFTAGNATYGAELWTSDGTPGGTFLVDDINPGRGDGTLGAGRSNGNVEFNSGGVVAFNGALYFSATDVLHGFQLWRSDGTAAGTAEVDQINVTPAGTTFDADFEANQTVTIDGITYFAADDGADGSELWRTDGTATGTWMVDNIQPASRGSGSAPGNLFDFDGTLYFDARSDALYKSDGTAAGTTLVSANTNPFDFTALGGSLYFFSYDADNYPKAPIYLMKLDAATGQVTTIMMVAPATSFGPAAATGMGTLGGALYFGAIDAGGHWALWKTDGTADGTSEVAAFAGPTGVMTQRFLDVNGSMYFVANDGTNGAALWKTDGTAAGTTIVWATGSPYSTPANLYAFDGAIYFNVYNFEYGFFTSGLYRSDGTAAGTAEESTAATYQDPTFTTQGGKLYFLASSPKSGGAYTVYTTDGTPAGTMPVDASLSVVPWNTPSGMLEADGRVYFIANDGTHGNELWQTDGTTTTLADPSESADGWTVQNLLGATSNGLEFGATDAAHGKQLWDLPLAPSAATASFEKSDSTTSGNWAGAYGSDGYAIVGGGMSLPSYVSMDVLGSQYWQWAGVGQADGRAPLVGAGSSLHEAATDYSGSSFTVDLNFNDDKAHQVAFYLVDYDRFGRSETVTVTNADTGQVLDTRSVSNFQNGQYLVYTMSGHMNVTFTNNSGSRNAVLSAVLFDPAVLKATAAFTGVDARTQGNWAGVYGAQGYEVVGGDMGLPPYASVTPSAGTQGYEWGSANGDLRELQVGPGSASRVAACFYSNAPEFSLDVNLADGQTHQVSLYLLDYDVRNRAETVIVSDAATGAVLDSRTFSDFTQGVYARWNLSGHVRLTILNAGGLNEVVSGIFIDPVTRPAATYVGQDATTQGTWTGTYGGDGYVAFNAGSSLPSYATLTVPSTVQNYTWAYQTSEARGLQAAPGSPTRVAACDYSDSPSFSIDLNLTDGNVHRVAFYFLDYDNRGRAETITISDATTGAVLDAQSMSNFTQGKYQVWNLSGHVRITITNAGGLNEVLSGIFFG
jgi:ELWxxDGT repeat protein